MLTIQIVIATHRPDGISRVASMVLPPAEGIGYVVSWQAHENAPIPKSLEREDVEVVRYDGVGLSNNRNNALARCTADIIIIADDDESLYPEGIEALRSAFADNPDVEFITFRSDHGDPSRFPVVATPLGRHLPRGYYVSSIEMAFRRAAGCGLQFCPELGLGAKKFLSGEDELFLRTAIKRGVKCCFFPITVCSHPDASTGLLSNLSSGVLRAQGVVMALSFSPAGILPRLLLKALRLKRNRQAGFFRALYFLAAGALAAPGVLRRNRATLW